MLESRKLLVTGCESQAGRAVLARYGSVAEIWGLSSYRAPGSWDEAIALGVRAIRFDPATDSLDELPADFDYVLNFAEERAPASAREGLMANCDSIARLMKHCHSAKAFLHLSTQWVYKPKADHAYAYREEDDIGSNRGGQYAPSKMAGEGAVRGGSKILGLPAVICRANVVYGGARGTSLIDDAIERFLDTGEVPVPATGGGLAISPLHVNDLADLVEPSLRLATVPATVLNWTGDEAVEWKAIFDHVGELVGRAPRFVPSHTFDEMGGVQDPSRRQAVAGPVSVGWREGVLRRCERAGRAMAGQAGEA